MKIYIIIEVCPEFFIFLESIIMGKYRNVIESFYPIFIKEINYRNDRKH